MEKEATEKEATEKEAAEVAIKLEAKNFSIYSDHAKKRVISPCKWHLVHATMRIRFQLPTIIATEEEKNPCIKSILLMCLQIKSIIRARELFPIRKTIKCYTRTVWKQRR